MGKRKIMIVEDDHAIRETLSEVLEDANFESEGAVNGQDALDRLHANPIKPCVILLDMMMPVMDGRRFRVVQQADPSLRGIPVIVLTAQASACDTARELGTAACLRKPVDLDMLLSTIEHVCPAA